MPCKSDCQTIFLKKQGINTLYTKLWLVRPLIKNIIPDSSHWYLSNVTFATSPAFQMREEYIFGKKYFLKTGPQRGLIVALRNFTRYFIMFLDGVELWIENKKKVYEKLFSNCDLRFVEPKVSKQLLWKESALLSF